jgi:hypothetical protein
LFTVCSDKIGRRRAAGLPPEATLLIHNENTIILIGFKMKKRDQIFSIKIFCFLDCTIKEFQTAPRDQCKFKYIAPCGHQRVFAPRRKKAPLAVEYYKNKKSNNSINRLQYKSSLLLSALFDFEMKSVEVVIKLQVFNFFKTKMWA